MKTLIETKIEECEEILFKLREKLEELKEMVSVKKSQKPTYVGGDLEI